MGGKQSGSSKSTTKVEPWGPSHAYLKDIMPLARGAYDKRSYAPESFSRATGVSSVVDPNNKVLQAESAISRRAVKGIRDRNTSVRAADRSVGRIAGGQMNTAQNAALGAMRGEIGSGIPGQPGRLAVDPSSLSLATEAAKQDALGSAIPAAVSQFAGAGMANSSQAMSEVGRAATQAVAPISYGAAERNLDRQIGLGENAAARQFAAENQNAQRDLAAAQMMGSMGGQMTQDQLRAAALAPSTYQGTYMPAQMLNSVGQAKTGRHQQRRDARVANYYNDASSFARNVQGYADVIGGVSGLGRTQTSTQPGPSQASKVAGAGLGALGTYGSLAAAGVAGPWALAGAGLAGVMGLF